MKVLSLFDGMSCGQIALNELGIIPEMYLAEKLSPMQSRLHKPISQIQYNWATLGK